MGRWKANNDNSPYYDPNDSGPNQVAVPEGYNPDGSQKSPAQPTNNKTGTASYPYQDLEYHQTQTNTSNYNNTGTGYDNSGIGAGTPRTTSAPVVPPSYAYMEGINTDKLNDPTHTTPKYVASRVLASGGSLADAAKAVGATVLDEDKMRLPTGEIIDTRRDIEGANQLQWLVTYDPNWKTDSGSSGRGGINSNAGGRPSSSNDLWIMLMQRASQGLNIDPNDPIIAGQVNAFRAEQERGVRNDLADQAEAQGPNANLTLERRVANEKAAQSTGALQSQLINNELVAKRNEIAQALAQMGGMLTEQQRIDLQRELGKLNASLEQQRITNQNNQFLDEYGLRVTDLANTWDWRRSGGGN